MDRAGQSVCKHAKHTSLADPEPLCDHCLRETLRSQSTNLLGLGPSSRLPPFVPPLRLRPGNPFALPLQHQVPLKLSEAREDAYEQPINGFGRVYDDPPKLRTPPLDPGGPRRLS